MTSPRRVVYLKIETGLPTGSFKVRGAVHSLTANLARRPIGEVVAASTGNHGAAVAYAGKLLGITTTIFLPCDPNPVKAARIRELGGRIVETGTDLSAAIDAAAAYCDERAGAARFFLHDASDPDIPAATAGIGAEIVQELPNVTTIYVPMGDTALVRGVASAAKTATPSVRIVGVAAFKAPAYAEAWRTGETVETPTAETIADGLAVRRTLAPNIASIRSLVDEVRLVGEDEMLDAIVWLKDREQVAAEPAGAAATAAFLQRAASREQDDVGIDVLLVTGRNISPQAAALADARRPR